MSPLLAAAARALETEPSVMAPLLAQVRRARNWDSAMLAAWLGMAVTHLPRLALCRRPDVTDRDNADGVAALARYVGCDADRLWLLLMSFPAADVSQTPSHVYAAE